MSKSTDLTIVLVHGALTDGSVWNGVSGKLQAEGFVTVAPAMPLRGLHTDAEYLASFLDTIDGPVLIAGHSYGGSVISHPVIAKNGVKALIFVAAFAPEAGESAGELNGRWPGSKLGEETAVIRPYRGGKDPVSPAGMLPRRLRWRSGAGDHRVDGSRATTGRHGGAERIIPRASHLEQIAVMGGYIDAGQLVAGRSATVYGASGHINGY
jgi:pimeloyl-ACP methyl ester carboxylesterase